MSSNSNSSSSSPPRVPPHIRVNTVQEDLLATHAPGHGATRAILPSRPSTAPQRSHLTQNQIYPDLRLPDSTERLLPPQSRPNKIRDEEAGIKTSELSGFSSRRSSWDSDRSRESRGFDNPFADSRGPSRTGSDDENVNTQTVSEKYNILPSAGLLLFPEDVEKDDYLHNPDPGGKEPNDCDIFTRRGFVNVGGLALITLGILVLFIGYPVL
jgi:beta-glucan synthesis-associated protein KRE6